MIKPNNPRDPDAVLDAAMASMDSGGELQLQRLDMPAAPSVPSPTLAALHPSRRPHPGTVCETCQNSVWFASDKEVRNFCRVMFVVVWSTKEPNALTDCDGQFIDQEGKAKGADE